MKQKKKNYLRLTFKLLISLLTLLFVLYKIDWQHALLTIAKANWFWLIVAVLLFNLSQIISAIRLQQLFNAICLRLSTSFNIKLYYIGMLYNLVLPGGIGGDAYKVYLLRKKFNKRTQRLIKCLFADRLSGLVGLSILILSLVIYLPIFGDITQLLLIILVLTYPLFYLGWSQAFRHFKKSFVKVNLLALSVQLVQMICAFTIIKALGLNDSLLPYMLIFLLSSIATILPITIGGLGLREMVFLYAANFFDVSQEICISLSLLFFIITAISALPATGISLENKKRQMTQGSFASNTMNH